MLKFSRILGLSLALALPLACADGGSNDARPPSGEPTDGTGITPPTREPDASAAGPDAKAPPPPNPDEALSPVVDAITPNKATVGGVGPSITVSGENFVPRTIVQLDGVPLATTFISSTELRATIPSSKLASVATYRISAGTSPPGGGASREVSFSVENPLPELKALAPLSAVSGSGSLTIELTGASFVSGAKAVFGTTDLVTSVVDQTTLKATVPAALLASPGSVPVRVVNPTPGGGASSSIAFIVANPAAIIQSISPAAAFVNAAQLTLTVNGAGFVTQSQVAFNGQALTTRFVSPSKLEATVPALALDAAGDFPVTVENPAPGGGLSSPASFRVQYPVPVTTSLTPTSLRAGAGATTVTVTGVGFYPASQITFDGAPASTTYVDATHLEATLTANQVKTAGVITVRVVNPAPGGGMSSAVSIQVENGVPTISSLSPSTVKVGSPNTKLVVYGSGFVDGSTVRSNGMVVTTTYVSGSKLEATVPANQLLNPGTVAITVTNPSPGGGTSAAKNLTVGCDTSGSDILLSYVGQTYTRSTAFDTAQTMGAFKESTFCDATVIQTNVLLPARYWVVQNTSGAPITLGAWADCDASGKQDDAFLTFYKRPTPPVTDQERLACAHVVAEGVSGAGGYSSPEAGVSQYCPGLTKSNGGGMMLGVCEKAVVHIQPWSVANASYPPPPYVKIKAE